MTDQNEPCCCGSPVRVHYGPDIRFTPPCSKPLMYRAECSGDCLRPSFTSFTQEQALKLWNERMRRDRAALAQPVPTTHSLREEDKP